MNPSQATRITLSDVAREAGVSAMTVSKALRGTGRLSEETRIRVKEVAERLGYVPNLLAGNLSSQSGTIVGVIVPSIGEQVFAEIVAGVTSVLRPQGLQCFIGESRFDPQQEAEVVRTMLSLQPAGLILTGGIARLPETRRLLQGRRCPAVNLWAGDTPEFDATVGPLHRDAGRMVADRLLRSRPRAVAYIGGQLGADLCASLRREGLEQRLASAGCPLIDLSDPTLPRDDVTGHHLTGRFLDQGMPADAIHYLNDAMALGGLRRLHEAGVDVPGRLQVMGFNGTSMAYCIGTRLTTLTLDRFGLGVLAGLALTGTPPAAPVCPVLVEGNTTR